MKVKLLEHYRDAKVHYRPEQVVDVSKDFGEWLLEHHKAQQVQEPVREARHLDVEPQFEQAEEPPKPTRLENRKRSRGAK